MIATVLAMNIFACSERIFVCLFREKILEPKRPKDCCHDLEIFFKLNEDHFIIASRVECREFACGIRGKLVTRSLSRKQELVDKFSEWIILPPTIRLLQCFHLPVKFQSNGLLWPFFFFFFSFFLLGACVAGGGVVGVGQLYSALICARSISLNFVLCPIFCHGRFFGIMVLILRPFAPFFPNARRE